MLIILGIYVTVHAIIIAALLQARSKLPATQRTTVPRWLLVSTATPLVGPAISCFGLAKLARSYRAAMHNPDSSSDCGLAAGVAYGLTSIAASWAASPALGFLALCCLILFFGQLRGAAKYLAAAGQQ